MKKIYDVLIIGAGAAGLSAAAVALRRGRRVAVVDMGTPARKVLACGGGRCNFTNAAVGRDRYVGENPDFVRGALARVGTHDILDWAAAHGLQWVEKVPGQYFCATGAADVVAALMRDARGADIFQNTTVHTVTMDGDNFVVRVPDGALTARRIIVATGGISFPALGVSDVGYAIAKQFGHRIVPPRPGLCAIRIAGWPSDLAGLGLSAEITIGPHRVRDSMLFTHFGIGGPAGYRASLFVRRDADMHINLMPGVNARDILRAAKTSAGKKTVAGVLGQYLPGRAARWIAGDDARHIADYRDDALGAIAGRVNDIVIPGDKIRPHGLAAAEVSCGGVATDAVSSKTMESKLQPGLFFAGEVLDIAGDLGGFNLHWAWASGRVAGENA